MPLEEIAVYENDISLEADDIQEIINEVREEPSLLLLRTTPIKITPITANVVAQVSQNLQPVSIEQRTNSSDTKTLIAMSL